MVTYSDIIALGVRKHRAWKLFQRRQQKLGALLDPRTGGDAGLIHNWGNEQARAAIANGWRRWEAYWVAFDTRFNGLAREYALSGNPRIHPLWPPKMIAPIRD